jgi:hypothetical protein
MGSGGIISFMLKPDRTIQRFLISSPSRFVSEYNSEKLSIHHAFRSEAILEHSLEGPFSLSHYVVSFSTPGIPFGELRLPEYNIDFILVYLSVLFGKRFDNHGPFIEHGVFRLPDLGSQKPILHHKLGFINHQPRANYGLPLVLDQFAIMKSFSK